MATILVTGGTGFIGNHVVRRLCAEKVPVRILARPTSQLACLESLPVEVVIGDLTDRESLKRAVKGCQIVFHVAADYRLWARHPEELYRSNVDGTANMLAVAFESGVSRVVYTSTVGTIGLPEDGRKGRKKDFPDPRQLAGHYKRSKFHAEQTRPALRARWLSGCCGESYGAGRRGDRKPTETGKDHFGFSQSEDACLHRYRTQPGGRERRSRRPPGRHDARPGRASAIFWADGI